MPLDPQLVKVLDVQTALVRLADAWRELARVGQTEAALTELRDVESEIERALGSVLTGVAESAGVSDVEYIVNVDPFFKKTKAG